MTIRVAIAHFSEGAGHATRMLGIASSLERYEGIEVKIAGGGPGADFVRMNGYDEFEPHDIDFIGKRKETNDLWASALNLKNSLKRFTDFRSWMDRIEPDVVVADDPYAFLAARTKGLKVYRVDHMKSEMFERKMDVLRQAGVEKFSDMYAEKVFFTCLNPESREDTEQVEHVDPIIFRPSNCREAEKFDVLLIPGTYSDEFEPLRKKLDENGYDVKLVRGEDWEKVPALYPFIKKADYTVCAGFSSISESVVSGTSCIIKPTLGEHESIARIVEENDITGVEVGRTDDEILEIVENGETEEPEYTNGSRQVAKKLREELEGMTDREGKHRAVENIVQPGKQILRLISHKPLVQSIKDNRLLS